MAAELRFEKIFKILARHEIEFILVGGMAAILHGSPLSTEDLDLVYDPSSENVARLAEAMEELEACYLDPAGRHIVPDVSKLTTMRMHLLRTKHGRVDLLKTIEPDLGFEDLVSNSRLFEIEGTPLQVLELGAIIDSKAHANRPKDRFQLPFLRQLQKEILLREEGE